MKETEEYILLNDWEDAYIAQCKCCAKIIIVHKNLALKFTNEEFLVFKKYFDDLDLSHYQRSTSEKNIFVNSPLKCLVFCFDLTEVLTLIDKMNEANLMLEVFDILYS